MLGGWVKDGWEATFDSRPAPPGCRGGWCSGGVGWGGVGWGHPTPPHPPMGGVGCLVVGSKWPPGPLQPDHQAPPHPKVGVGLGWGGGVGVGWGDGLLGGWVKDGQRAIFDPSTKQPSLGDQGGVGWGGGGVSWVVGVLLIGVLAFKKNSTTRGLQDSTRADRNRDMQG